jgi:F0F1-type ATP synthase assembly protein I
MADNTDNKPNPSVDEDMAELKREIANLKAAIAERAQDVYDSAAERASRTSDALRAQAGVVRENPATFSSAFVAGGILGLLIGMALGPSQPAPRRWYDRQ